MVGRSYLATLSLGTLLIFPESLVVQLRLKLGGVIGLGLLSSLVVSVREAEVFCWVKVEIGGGSWVLGAHFVSNFGEAVRAWML